MELPVVGATPISVHQCLGGFLDTGKDLGEIALQETQATFLKSVGVVAIVRPSSSVGKGGWKLTPSMPERLGLEAL